MNILCHFFVAFQCEIEACVPEYGRWSVSASQRRLSGTELLLILLKMPINEDANVTGHDFSGRASVQSDVVPCPIGWVSTTSAEDSRIWDHLVMAFPQLAEGYS